MPEDLQKRTLSRQTNDDDDDDDDDDNKYNNVVARAIQSAGTPVTKEPVGLATRQT